ncbi:MAG TPA: hypothetical protein VFW98_08325 [Gemmatimonadaceae bacterium]|nr:hypothetical protein [Gemmatimonadaceae bacterium]
MSADVKLVFTADGTELRSEIDSDLKALGGFARAADVTNEMAVKAFREQAAAQRQLMQEVGATGEQMMKLDALTRKFEQSVTRAAVGAEKAAQREGMAMVRAQESAIAMDRAMEKAAVQNSALGGSARTGGNALAVLAFTATGVTNSVQGATVALGGLAYGIASASKSAKVAASASGIGALAVLLGVLYEAAVKAKTAIESIPTGSITAQQKMHIAGLKTVQQAEAELARSRASVARLDEAAANRRGTAGQKALQAAVNAQAYMSAILQHIIDLRKQDKEQAAATAKEIAKQVQAEQQRATAMQQSLAGAVEQLSIRNEGAFKRRQMAAEQQFATDKAHIAALTLLTQKRRDDLMQFAATRRQLTLQQLAEEKAALNQRASLQAAAGGDDFVKSYRARLKLIEVEKQAQIASGVAVQTAEAQALQARQAQRKALTTTTLTDLQTIEQATIDSKNREVHAIGLAAKTARRVELGYEAVSETVQSIKAIGKALGYAAAGDFGAAALSMASSVQHAAAAALAAKEAGSGGGAASGGGGGGAAGGGGASGPRESSRLTGAAMGAGRGQDTIKIELVLVTKDPTGKETSRVRQQIQRLQDRNQPIRMSA